MPDAASTDTSVIEARSYKTVSIDQICTIKWRAEYWTTDHPPLEVGQDFTTELFTAQTPSERNT